MGVMDSNCVCVRVLLTCEADDEDCLCTVVTLALQLDATVLEPRWAEHRAVLRDPPSVVEKWL